MKQTGVNFNNLPIEAKKALVELGNLETLEDAKAMYCDSRFILEDISSEEAKKRCMERSDDLWGCKTFEEYHSEYLKAGDIPNHYDSMYPVVEDSNGDEWLIDGWHRFHSYILYGKEKIPVLSFEK